MSASGVIGDLEPSEEGHHNPSYDHDAAVIADGRVLDASPLLRRDRRCCCYRPRYLNIWRLNCLWTIRHSSARIAGNLIT